MNLLDITKWPIEELEGAAARRPIDRMEYALVEAAKQELERRQHEDS